MKTSTTASMMIGACLLGGVFASGCSDDETSNPTTSSSSATSASGGNGGSSTQSGGADTGGHGGQGGNDSYAFDTTDFEDYIQTDRHGAVEAGTVGISAPSGLGLNGEDISLRDDYNASNPAEDATLKWVPDIIDSLTALHAALDDDITAAGLTPATNDESAAQAGKVIIPDTIKFDPSKPASYPNGRALTDQVVDLTIAAALVKLNTSPATPITVLADLPLNPPANDVPFKADFPYLADPH